MKIIQPVVGIQPEVVKPKWVTAALEIKGLQLRGRKQGKGSRIPVGAIPETKFICDDCPQPFRWPGKDWWKYIGVEYDLVPYNPKWDNGWYYRKPRNVEYTSSCRRCNSCKNKKKRWARGKRVMLDIRYAIGGRNIKSIRFSRTLAVWDHEPTEEELQFEIRKRTEDFNRFRKHQSFKSTTGKNIYGCWFREIVLRRWATKAYGVTNEESIEIDWEDSETDTIVSGGRWTANIHFHVVIASSNSKKYWDSFDGEMRKGWGDPIHIQDIGDMDSGREYINKHDKITYGFVSDKLVDYVTKQPVQFKRNMQPFGKWHPNTDATKLLELELQPGRKENRPKWIRKDSKLNAWLNSQNNDPTSDQ